MVVQEPWVVVIIYEHTKGIDVFKGLLLSFELGPDLIHRSSIAEDVLNCVEHRVVKES